MIKIYAKRKGDEVELTMKIVGNGADIVNEAASILTKLPEQIGAANPFLLQAVTEKIAEKMADETGDAPDDSEEVDDNAEPVEG